jgi:hypothetical protein
MALHPLPGFRSFRTHHCVTGSLQHIYAYHGRHISEDMLLGLGEGVGFIYWHQHGALPFLGGRANPSAFETTAGRRTGVRIGSQSTSSPSVAERTLLSLLEAGEPVMLQCDMGYLPYLDFGGHDYHFGGHVVVACGYEATRGQVLLADRDGLHAVSLTNLRRARGSSHKPFPARNRWYCFDFGHARAPRPLEVLSAARAQARRMLAPPIHNLGVSGIRRAAAAVCGWPAMLDTRALRRALLQASIFIDATGGSGGGCFRYMFSRFLREASVATRRPGLLRSAREFKRVGDEWEAVATQFRQAARVERPPVCLPVIRDALLALADHEQAAFAALEIALR